MNSVNPYESPVECQSSPLAAQARPPIPWSIILLRVPAVVLIVLTTVQMLGLSIFAVRVLLFLSRKPLTLSKLFLQNPEFTTPCLSIACCLFICVGAAKMWELRFLWLCRVTALVACIPMVTPFIWIGVPFGIWSAILLFRKDVAAKFGRA
jgi:hypothetical protein